MVFAISVGVAVLLWILYMLHLRVDYVSGFFIIWRMRLCFGCVYSVGEYLVSDRE